VVVDPEPVRGVVPLPAVGDEPFAGVQGTVVVFEGVCPLDDPVVELWAAA
jgi:hypothetical protein